MIPKQNSCFICMDGCIVSSLCSTQYCGMLDLFSLVLQCGQNKPSKLVEIVVNLVIIIQQSHYYLQCERIPSGCTIPGLKRQLCHSHLGLSCLVTVISLGNTKDTYILIQDRGLVYKASNQCTTRGHGPLDITVLSRQILHTLV